MASSVTLRFFDVDWGHDSDPLEAVILDISNLPMKKREVTLSNGVAIRLEHLEQKDNVLFGDLTRVQDKNLPGQVLDSKTEKLPFDRLGHFIVFAYDSQAKVLALQFDRIARAGVTLAYFANFTEKSVYVHSPIISGTDSLKALEKSKVKSFTVRMGGLHNLDAIDDGDNFIDGLATMGDFFDGRQVEVKISTRALKTPMDNGKVIRTIKSLLNMDGDNVKAIYADTFDEHDPYNFIKELLTETGELELPDNNPVDNRKKRIKFAKESYGKHKSTLRSQNTPN